MPVMSTASNESPYPQFPLETSQSFQKRPWYKRLDYLSLLTLVLGFLVLITLWLLLALFWSQSIAWNTGKKPWKLWDWITCSGWTSRFITICTAVMRSIVAFQASISTAMVAALVLEVVGVSIRHVPYYSIVRALYPSPYTLLRTEAFETRDRWTILTAGLIFIEAAVIVASQFLSTIYLSDVSSGTILNETTIGSVPLIDFTINPQYSPWTTRTSNQRFAELSEALTKGKNFHDTGHTYRAFLPFDDAYQRLRLREYSGPVQVMDQRVVCVSPTLTKLELGKADNTNSNSLTGEFELDQSYDMIENTPMQHPMKFNCQIRTEPIGADDPPPSSLCYPYGGLNDLATLQKRPILKPENETQSTGTALHYGISHDPSFILIFYHLSSFPNSSVAEQPMNMTARATPWTYIGNGGNEHFMAVAACSINLGISPFYMHFSSIVDGIEPDIKWDNARGGYDTYPMRRQLGVLSNYSSLEERGLLSIQPRAEWEIVPGNRTKVHDDWIWTKILETTVTGASPNSTSYSVILDSNGVHPVDQLHVELFRDAYVSTGSPALALQTLFARLCRIIYYDYISWGAYGMGSAQVAFSADLILPVGWYGFISASCIIATHIIVTVVVTILFFRHTKFSILGNHWQAVAQVASEETGSILREADRMTDKEVERSLTSQLSGLKRIVALQESKNGRIVPGTKTKNQ
ncbi:hypothetical protein F4821DRAFT_276608 [Hypoxylon rubiginosum]|uniref:Uncharacterized protein n=1 Tax=Hypoxylon rubiginosum TaxID=110542 RepID=A0ACC0CIE5_9PEZI|nr:hypothetical protein F4821DRAFT_276608 [Hypoxylon rubiginosum]